VPKSFPTAVAAPLRRLAERARGAYGRMTDPDRRNLVSLRPEGPARGTALVAHVVEGLMAAPDDPLIRRHNHFDEARLIAEALLERGFAVDVISYRNRWFVPKKPYDLFICSREHFEVLVGRMPPRCITIVHLDTAHWLANNAAATARLREVQQRRGVALWSMMPIGMNRGIEAADYATLLGNGFDHETYAYAGKQVFQVPNPGTLLHPWDDAKDFAACRNRFLWLGSNGLVHKGLDLVLEAFARMPEMHLTVCGPLARDPHFVRAFQRELKETPNLHAHG
jgi:glycosyltransferase involved in cell wall biosynthesis